MFDFQEQFYQAMARLRGSKAASTSTSTQEDVRVTEITDGLIITRPATKKEKEPEIIDLQEYASSGKAASVQGINKVKMIHDFIASNGSIY